MKRAALLFVLLGCADRETVPFPDKQTIFDVPGADSNYADMRLVGFCVQRDSGQAPAQIVGVTPYGRGRKPGYRVAAPGAPEPTMIGTAGIRDRLVACG